MGDNKMKILMLNYEFPPLGGGASNATEYLLKEFSLITDMKIDLITSSPINKMEVEKLSDNIIIYKLPIDKKDIHYWTQKEILVYSIKAIRFIRKLMKRDKYDLCHAFFGFPCGLIAYLFRKKIPYIVSLRGSDVPGFSKRFSIQYIFLKPMLKIIWRNSKSVIANSEGLKRLALRTSPNQDIEIIHNGIDINEFKPSHRKNKTIKILCVSRLIERKGIKYLIGAIPQILKNYNNFKVTIIGKGSQEQELKKMSLDLNIEEYIDFMGYVAHSKLPKIYSKSEIFVLPSLKEGMSNTVLEAIASGISIITTDTGGTQELIKDNGIIVPMNDSEAIADATIQLINDSNLRREMGKKSRKIAENMSWEDVAEAYLKLYAQLK
ncbi:MAG: glycosyltransferase family 4 protein [Candidatus Methanofastidiosia archaeon]